MSVSEVAGHRAQAGRGYDLVTSKVRRPQVRPGMVAVRRCSNGWREVTLPRLSRWWRRRAMGRRRCCRSGPSVTVGPVSLLAGAHRRARLPVWAYGPLGCG
jgi:hypothetical protein